MSILDKAKTAAERARGQATHGAMQARAQLMEVQARRQHGKLIRQLGILTDRDVVVRCIAEGRDPARVRAGDLAQETLFWVASAPQEDSSPSASSTRGSPR